MKRIVEKKINLLVSQMVKKGNDVNGDSYFYYVDDDVFVCVLADGLGSGEGAFESSSIVIETVKENPHLDVVTLMEFCNEALFLKRGAAVTILKFHFDKKQFDYCSIGNIRFTMYSPSGKFTHPLPVTGYICGKPLTFRKQTFSYEPLSLFLFYTDGLEINNSKEVLSKYNTVDSIANKVTADYMKKNNDDITFIVGKLLD
ncbi:PP2C family serine/threonine-protein phosphatase [Bacillus kwashiorkori]|uniref:PP2C family serine/threonine-protein phosphatase n=1 Tax=Bacillus kwashiorkori TaxID=1522318 RepID=UPI000781DE11|nr:PP2C family serine/threonine-protein phosphatase [Bacillus kwashiorkori]